MPIAASQVSLMTLDSADRRWSITSCSIPRAFTTFIFRSRESSTRMQSNNANTGGGFYTQGGQFYYVRGLGLLKSTEDIGEVVVGSNNGVPVRVKDVGTVTIGNAPRLGIFGFQEKAKNNEDAVEGVILMRRGEQTQNVLGGEEQKPTNSIATFCRPTSKFILITIAATWFASRPTPSNTICYSGMILVFLVLLFFLVSFRAAVIAALTIPLALLFAFIFLARHRGSRQSAFHRRDRFRNHHRRHDRDGRKHLSRTGRATRHRLRIARSDSARRPRRGPPDFLFGRGDHRRIFADLCADRPLGKACFTRWPTLWPSR